MPKPDFNDPDALIDFLKNPPADLMPDPKASQAIFQTYLDNHMAPGAREIKQRERLVSALLADPRNIDAATNLAAQFKLGDLYRVIREVVRIAREDLGLAPDFGPEEAALAFIEQDSDNVEAYEDYLCLVIKLANFNNDGEALVHYAELAVQIRREYSFEDRFHLIAGYLTTDRLDQAQSVLDTLKEEIIATRLAQGILHRLRGDEQQAMTFLTQALERNQYLGRFFIDAVAITAEDERWRKDLPIVRKGFPAEAALCERWFGNAWRCIPDGPAWLKKSLMPHDASAFPPWLTTIYQYTEPSEGKAPYEAIKEALAVGPEAVPLLAAALENRIGDLLLEHHLSAPWSIPILLLLLAELKSSAVFKPAHRIFRIGFILPFNNLMGDFAIEELPHCLAAGLAASDSDTPARSLPPELLAMVFDVDLDEHAAVAAIAAVGTAIHAGTLSEPIGRELAQRWFIEQQNAPGTRDKDYRWLAICELCADHGWEEFWPDIEAAYAKGLVDEASTTFEEMEESMRSDEWPAWRYPDIHIDTVARVAKYENMVWTWESRPAILDNARKSEPHRYKKPGKKLSRNALCPCGSGKKYKKCCL